MRAGSNIALQSCSVVDEHWIDRFSRTTRLDSTRLGWPDSRRIRFGIDKSRAAHVCPPEVAHGEETASESTRSQRSKSDPYPERTIQVETLEVLHPKQGAVYWEGPVNVSLTVTLGGKSV